MGKIEVAASVFFGLLFIAAAISVPLVYCSAWRDAYVVDGVFCFVIAAAEADDQQSIAQILAGIALVLFLVSIWGTVTGQSSC